MKQTVIEIGDCFKKDRLVSVVTSFYSPIKRNNLKLFTSTGKTVKMKIGRETSILEVNGNIIAKIISWSIKSRKAVNFKEALRYPLCLVLLSFAFPDGSKRSTAKTKLLKELDVSDAIVSNKLTQIMLIFLMRW